MLESLYSQYLLTNRGSNRFTWAVKVNEKLKLLVNNGLMLRCDLISVGEGFTSFIASNDSYGGVVNCEANIINKVNEGRVEDSKRNDTGAVNNGIANKDAPLTVTMHPSVYTSNVNNTPMSIEDRKRILADRRVSHNNMFINDKNQIVDDKNDSMDKMKAQISSIKKDVVKKVDDVSAKQLKSDEVVKESETKISITAVTSNDVIGNVTSKSFNWSDEPLDVPSGNNINVQKVKVDQRSEGNSNFKSSSNNTKSKSSSKKIDSDGTIDLVVTEIDRGNPANLINPIYEYRNVKPMLTKDGFKPSQGRHNYDNLEAYLLSPKSYKTGIVAGITSTQKFISNIIEPYSGVVLYTSECMMDVDSNQFESIAAAVVRAKSLLFLGCVYNGANCLVVFDGVDATKYVHCKFALTSPELECFRLSKRRFSIYKVGNVNMMLSICNDLNCIIESDFNSYDQDELFCIINIAATMSKGINTYSRNISQAIHSNFNFVYARLDLNVKGTTIDYVTSLSNEQSTSSILNDICQYKLVSLFDCENVVAIDGAFHSNKFSSYSEFLDRFSKYNMTFVKYYKPGYLFHGYINVDGIFTPIFSKPLQPLIAHDLNITYCKLGGTCKYVLRDDFSYGGFKSRGINSYFKKGILSCVKSDKRLSLIGNGLMAIGAGCVQNSTLHIIDAKLDSYNLDDPINVAALVKLVNLYGIRFNNQPCSSFSFDNIIDEASAIFSNQCKKLTNNKNVLLPFCSIVSTGYLSKIVSPSCLLYSASTFSNDGVVIKLDGEVYRSLPDVLVPIPTTYNVDGLLLMSSDPVSIGSININTCSYVATKFGNSDLYNKVIKRSKLKSAEFISTGDVTNVKSLIINAYRYDLFNIEFNQMDLCIKHHKCFKSIFKLFKIIAKEGYHAANDMLRQLVFRTLNSISYDALRAINDMLLQVKMLCVQINILSKVMFDCECDGSILNLLQLYTRSKAGSKLLEANTNKHLEVMDKDAVTIEGPSSSIKDKNVDLILNEEDVTNDAQNINPIINNNIYEEDDDALDIEINDI